ncbi:MAG: arsenate reductase ArsC [Acidobacteria bacterium]|nr:arsenate reductase ArsC [Acidobacteriota bacterium]
MRDRGPDSAAHPRDVAGGRVPRALFVCTHNAGRSQIAEALFNAYAGGRARATSAGTQPVAALNIAVVAAMAEAGYDIISAKPKPLSAEMIAQADRVITMGCGDDPSCPAVEADEDWGIDDPAAAPMPKVREIRDQIARRVRALLREMGIEPVR